ncbi:SNF2-related protein [Vagococcus sp. PNs007]|uniref:SNF2-related protein n=1 Tax=Vagococcus proximus TaxID=2991417 RepID=A0ABT5X2C7_9ENTE|nr:SNF2-related protein [Vagococcus proximus]MDF0480164.1 SNF2-related protein [Vagococcus proximus]
MLKKVQKTLKSSYNSMSSDITEEFYIPVLSESISYRRVSGYFSCKALAIYAEGLDRIFENRGYVQFIISQNISERDFDEIKRGYNERSKSEVLTEEDKKRLGNLAYMISKGWVDVKFGFVENGLFHTKWGLFEDDEGDVIYINGSMNETANAIENNFDSFDVDFSWDTSSNVRDRIKSKRNEFQTLWNNEYPGVTVVEASKIVYPLIQEFDCGKIQKIVSSEKNEVLFDMDENYFYFTDETIDEIIKKKSFKTKFIYYIDEQKGYPYFRRKLTYKEIEKIIELAVKQANKHEFNFHISDKVHEFIRQERYTIEEYRKSGLTLKNKDRRWDDEFYKFREVVENEITRPLKELQLQSAMYMFTQKRAANFSVPGAGKTAMILGVFAYLNSLIVGQPINRILVVCPLNAFMSWKEEFATVFGDKKDLKSLSVHDDFIKGDRFKFELQWGSANLVLINYESLPKFQDTILKCLEGTKDTMLVYDEVHRVKGVESKRALTAIEIADKADYRFVLTGTPIPNSYLDIYNFLNILFKKEYKSYFGFEQSMLKNPNGNQVSQINKKLSPYFWRTNKENLGVPPADEDNIYGVKPSSEQLRLAEMIYNTTKYPLAVLIRMIQLSTNPELMNKAINYKDLGLNEEDLDSEDNQINSDIKKELEESIKDTLIDDVKEWDLSKVVSPKFDMGIQLVIEIVKKYKKVVVWGLFVDTLNKITDTLVDHGIAAKVIYGGTDREERDRIINIFKKDTDEIQVLVSNPNTLGESVSLHTIAHDAVYFEYNFNLTFMLQSRDRIHRLGLSENQSTRYYYLMTDSNQSYFNFIDRKIYDRLLEKEVRMKSAIDSDILIPEFMDDEIEKMKQIIESERPF